IKSAHEAGLKVGIWERTISLDTARKAFALKADLIGAFNPTVLESGASAEFSGKGLRIFVDGDGYYDVKNRSIYLTGEEITRIAGEFLELPGGRLKAT